jgi:Ca2+-transporting ATPase
MGPTCSIVYENEPIEPGTMNRPPRPFTLTFFNRRELGISLLQGIVITIASLLIYQLAVHDGFNEDQTRTLVFTVLISSNVVLTLVNRSFERTIFETLAYKNVLLTGVIAATVILTVLIYNIPAASRFFGLGETTAYHITISVVAGAVSVLWIEIVKWFRITSRSSRQTPIS